MNSPYTGRFKVTQQYKGDSHDGLDLVGIDSKEIHSTVKGVVQYAGWENPKDHSQGFGQYVCVWAGDGDYYYFAHLSELRVHTGQKVEITDVIGVEGCTGYTIPKGQAGSHCHYCIRPRFVGGVPGNHRNVSLISGIPNEIGVYDDGYRPQNVTAQVTSSTKGGSITAEIEVNGKKYRGTLSEIN